jgi:hypothetical protein
MAKATPDDLEAVRSVVAALQGFASPDQERILRWAREKLGLTSATATKEPDSIAPSQVDPKPAMPTAIGKLLDIKTFIDLKNPQTDSQFAAAVAYFYRFEAPEPQRKASITSPSFEHQCRVHS